MNHEFPTAAQVQMQCFIGGLLGRPISLDSIAQFSSRARQCQPKLTDRATMVVLALSCSPAPIIAKGLPLTSTVLWVVLRALHELGLVEINGDRWRATVKLTASGVALANEAKPAEQATINTKTCAS